MAFQAMMSGAECSVGATPLSQLLKHSDADRTLQQDRFVGPSAGPSSLRSRTEVPVDAQQQAFFAQARAQAGGPLAMDQLRREIDAMRAEQSPVAGFSNGFAASHYSAPSAEELAKMEAAYSGQAGPAMLDNAEWRQAFLASQGAVLPPSASPAPNQAYVRSGMNGSPFHMNGGYGMMNGGYARPLAQMPIASNDKGKGRFVELDDATWEAEFAKASGGESEKISSIGASFEDIKRVVEEEALEQGMDQADEELLKSLENTWKGFQEQNAAEAEMQAWEKSFSNVYNEPDEALDVNFDISQLDELLKHPDEYAFEGQNQHDADIDPYQRGLELLAKGAPLSEAALAFEAACRKGPQRAEAWKALGETLAADEKELKAIAALERACALDVDHPNTGAEGAWLSLAISYVNEGQEARSLAVLARWLERNYPSALNGPLPPSATDVTNPWNKQERVIDLFLKAARAGPAARTTATPSDADGMVDADVQVGLGVLFYGNSDYVRAKDCFEAALSVKPNDFLLWNRLGATMANGGSPEEAIHAYRRALDLRPTFTRAIYNLGVSCLNVNCYHEAAEHLLAALELHKTGRGSGAPRDGDADGSESLWSTLRRAFLAMGRTDLAARAKVGGDVDSFRADGFDWQTA